MIDSEIMSQGYGEVQETPYVVYPEPTMHNLPRHGEGEAGPMIGRIAFSPDTGLIELGRLLLLRYGNADNPLWLEFEQCLLKAELESLPLTAQIDLAPCLT
jgi:hypothetical protein